MKISLQGWLMIVFALLCVLLIALPTGVQAQGEFPPLPPEDGPVLPPVEPGDIWGSAGLLALVIERILQLIKRWWQAQPNQELFDTLAGSLLGVVLALMFKIDLFFASGLTAVEDWAKIAAIAISGVLIAWGANKLHDISEGTNKIREEGIKAAG